MTTNTEAPTGQGEKNDRNETATTAADGPVTMIRRFVITFAFAYFAMWIAALAPIILTLQLKVIAIVPVATERAGAISLILGVGAILGLLANPIAGRLSDRTVGRFGMRRPWLLVGGGIGLVGALICSGATSIGLLLLGWSLILLGVNVTTAVLLALLPDHVPFAKRGMMSGILGIAQGLAAVVGVVLAGALAAQSLTLAWVVPGVLSFGAIVLVCLVLNDRVLKREDRPRFDGGALLRTFWVNPLRHPNFSWVWFSRIAIFLGVGSVQNYQVFYLHAQLGLSTAAATALIPIGVALQSVMVILGSIVAGRLSDHFRRRKLFVALAALITLAGLVILAFATDETTFFISMALVGLGQGTYWSVDLALITEVLPDRKKDAAKDFGVMNIASLLPQSLAPAIAPLFLAIPFLSLTGQPNENYSLLYLAGALLAAFSAFAITRVKGVR